MSNKTVSLLRANRIKRNLTPTEAADRHPDVFNADAMRQRARSMPANKRWRFEPDAMERYAETEEGFATRQLHATGYLSRLSAAYLAKLFPAEDEQGRRRDHVWVVTGQLTAKLRRHWGLNLGDHNRKNRDDQRHHAVDAAVIGVTDRSLLQKVARVSGREAERGTDVDRLIAELPEPYEGFVDEVRSRMDTLMVSHRPDHGRTSPDDPHRTSGKLHEETYYGAVRDLPENSADLAIGNVVRRKPVADLSAKEVAQVRDPVIRAELVAVAEVADDKKALAATLADWSRRTGTRRVRVLKPEAGVVAIADKKTGEPYKHVVPAENAWVDIVETLDGEWKAHAVDVFAANTGRGEGWMSVYPEARFVMRLRKGDTVQLFDADGENRVKKVYRIGMAANVLYLAGVNEGGVLQKRHDDPDDPFRWDFANFGKLKERKARRVRFTSAGRLKTVPHGSL